MDLRYLKRGGDFIHSVDILSDLNLLREGEELPPVYKVFSSKPLDEGDLRRLFQPLQSFQVKPLPRKGSLFQRLWSLLQSLEVWGLLEFSGQCETWFSNQNVLDHWLLTVWEVFYYIRMHFITGCGLVGISWVHTWGWPCFLCACSWLILHKQAGLTLHDCWKWKCSIWDWVLWL